jgi:uncharacterized membrane protein
MPALIPVLRFVAVLSAGLFAGAALYINVAEHPARLGLDTRQAALQWAPSYKRATWLQAPLAVLSFACGAAVAFLSGGVSWLLPALLMGAVVPFTFIVVMPTNRQLLAKDRDQSAPSTRVLLVKWGKLHSVRTILSLLASALYMWELVRV